MTKSEELFEMFCTGIDLDFERVTTESYRTPDYIVRLVETLLVVEVKQFDPSPTELHSLRKSPEEWDESDAFSQGLPGERVRAKIDSAMPQLKRIADVSTPTLLVLYDNVQLWPEICDAYAIAVAMNGLETALISSEVAPEGGATILARWHGKSRRTTSNANTTLSAIGVLSEKQGVLALSLYHNYFARNPIRPELLIFKNVRHFCLERNPELSFSEWISWPYNPIQAME